MRARVFENLDIVRSDRVLVMNAGHGLLVWEAFRHTPEGLVVAQVRTDEEKAYLQQYISSLRNSNNSEVNVPSLVCEKDYIKVLQSLDVLGQGIRFEHIIGRNLLTDPKKGASILEEMKKRLAPKGDIVLCETMVSEASRLSEFIHMGPLQETLLKAEKKIYKKVPDREKILSILQNSFSNVRCTDYRFMESRSARETDVQRWVRNSYLPALPELSQNEAEKLERELVSTLCAAPLRWSTSCIIVSLS